MELTRVWLQNVLEFCENVIDSTFWKFLEPCGRLYQSWCQGMCVPNISCYLVNLHLLHLKL